MATAEILQAPASSEQLLDSEPQLRIYNPADTEIITTKGEMLSEVTRLIPELGVRNSGGLLYAVQEIRYEDGSAELQFLSGAPDTEEWNTKHVEQLNAKPEAELQMEIDKMSASYDQSINWNATRI